MQVHTHAPGSVCWVDLGTRDPDGTAAFYAALFGWTITPPDTDGYRICLLGGSAVAGLGPSDSAQAPYWTVNIAVDDVDRAAQACGAAGARTLVPPTRGGDAGAFAVLADPDGAQISLWEPGTQIGMGRSDEPDTFSHARLMSREPQSSAMFYAAAFDWHLDQRADGSAGFTRNGDVVAALDTWPRQFVPDRPSRWMVTFAVDHVGTATERAEKLGAERADPDTYGPGHIIDPAGAVLGMTAAR